MRLRNIIWSCNECIPNFHFIVRAKNLFPTSYKTGSLYLTLLLVCAMLLTGCSAGSQKTRCGAQQEEVDYSVKGSRPSTPNVLIPRQSGKNVIGSDEVEVDISNLQDGYLSVRWLSDPSKVKLQLTSDDEVTYTYDLPSDGSWTVFPLSSGSGRYLLGIYNNIEATMYAESFSTDLDVELTDEFGPFLYPNQYCWFTGSTKAIAEGQRICGPANSDVDAVGLIYNYLVSHVTYDYEEAETVQSGYLPDVDEVLSTGRGICLDYASLMSAMLRSQGIPTRMEIGYAGTAYHAWISCFVDDIGWVNGIIEFDGETWKLMDPTFASTQGQKKLQKFVGDGDNYRRVYLY